MLNLMRKHAGSWMIKVMMVLIAVVFVLYFGYSFRGRRANRVAAVNDSVISLDEYRGVYDRLLEQYRRQFGDALDQELLKRLDLKRQAMDQLIDRRLLLQEATRINLHVTDEELSKAIQKVTAFQYNGQFDRRQYERVLAQNRMTPGAFEESMKRDLLTEKMQGIVLGSIKVSDAEALETHKWREEQVSLDYVTFMPSSYDASTVTPAELETYFSEHQKAYETPAKRKARYVVFAFNELEPEVHVSEEEISQYFDLNRDNYATPKKVRARHILFKLEPDSTQEQIDGVRKRALEVLKEAKAGGDFAKLAEKHSDDPGTKTKGGDLDFFTEGQMVKPFSDAAFAMKPGEISDPVRTRFGWHLIKVEEVQEAKEPALAGVEEEIRKKLVKDAARNLAYDRAEEIYDASYGTGHLSDAAKAQEVETHETDFFTQDGQIEGIKQSETFANAAFDLGEDELSDILELADGYYILEVIGRKPAEIPEFADVEEEVRKQVIEVRQDELAKKAAEEFLSALKEGTEFQEEAENRKLERKSTELFKRFGSIPGIGFEQAITAAAFSLTPSEPLADDVIKGKQGYYVIRLKERKEADAKAFEDKKAETTRSIVLRKRQAVLDEWLAELRQRSEISVEPGFLD